MKDSSEMFIIKKTDGTEIRLYADYVEIIHKTYMFSEECNEGSDRLLLSIPVSKVDMVYKRGIIL